MGLFLLPVRPTDAIPVRNEIVVRNHLDRLDPRRVSKTPNLVSNKSQLIASIDINLFCRSLNGVGQWFPLQWLWLGAMRWQDWWLGDADSWRDQVSVLST